MASAAHSTLTDPYIHESKGVAAAAIDKVYVTDGAGSGTWKKLTTSQLDTASIFNANKYMPTMRYFNIGTPADQYIVFPVACTVTKIYGVLHGAIATADATFTFTNHSGGSLGTFVVATAGSAAGNVNSLTPAANNTFAAGERMKVAVTGGATNNVDEEITLLITQTA